MIHSTSNILFKLFQLNKLATAPVYTFKYLVSHCGLIQRPINHESIKRKAGEAAHTGTHEHTRAVTRAVTQQLETKLRQLGAVITRNVTVAVYSKTLDLASLGSLFRLGPE